MHSYRKDATKGAGVPFSLHRYSEKSLLLTITQGDALEAHTQLLAMLDALTASAFTGVQEVVKAYNSALIVFTNAQAASAAEAAWPTLWQPATVSGEQAESAIIDIPVCYDTALGNDLPALSVALGMPAAHIIALHTAVTYRVYMVGFLPGFAYMGMLPPQLQVPRKPNPMPTRAGSVAIAGEQTGIYPLNSPGGWHVLGHTPVPMFRANAQPPVYLQAGQRVRMYAIDISEYHHQKQQYDRGA